MRKILLAGFLMLFFCFAKGQDNVLFKIKYSPNHTYHFTASNIIELYADLSGNKEIAAKLAAQGITQPMNFYVTYVSSGLTTTASIGKDRSFPVVMTLNTPVINGMLNGQRIPFPLKKNNTEFYGRVNSDDKLNIDSLKGKKLSDSAATVAKQMMNKIIATVNFPEHAIKVGDSFTQNMPFDLPVGKGVTINIDMTYKLISIANGKAYFDIKQGLDMQMPVKQINISITGSGLGKLVYDIKNNFPVSLRSNLFMTINLKSENFSGGATANLTANNVYTVN